MIRIFRDNFPPNDIYVNMPNKGRQKWRVFENKIILDFKLNPKIFQDGKYDFPAHPSSTHWKSELIKIQGHKCCYCEKPIGTGDLDHFRPKKGWQQSTGTPIYSPGYYWLAYRWSNILLSCDECNGSGQKGNLFPIAGTRANSPQCDLLIENYELINPYLEDPELYIGFNKDKPISLHPRGHITIETLKLKDRADIDEPRKDKFQIYSLLKRVINSEIADDDIRKDGERLFKRVQRKKEAFSGMIIANINSGHL